MVAAGFDCALNLRQHAALADPDAETRADLIASEMLRARAVPPDALVRMLRKLAMHPLTNASTRTKLNRRAARLALP